MGINSRGFLIYFMDSTQVHVNCSSLFFFKFVSVRKKVLFDNFLLAYKNHIYCKQTKPLKIHVVMTYADLTSKSDDKELLLKLCQLYVVKWCCTRTTYQQNGITFA